MAVTTGRRQQSVNRIDDDDDDESSLDVSDMGGSEALQMICEYVSSALIQRCKTLDTESYSYLVREIRRLRDQLMVDVAPDDIAAANDATQAAAQLSNLLLGVSGSVSLLNETLHESLLSQLLTIPLWSVPQNVRKAALEVLLRICHGHLVSLGLQILVASLVPPPCAPSSAPTQDSTAGVAWTVPPTAATIQDSVVLTLSRVMALVPTAPATIAELLMAKLPHKSRDTESHCLALRATFAVASCPAGATIRDRLLAAVVDKLLELDVEIAWQDISERPDEEEEEPVDRQADIDAEVEAMFELEGMTDLELNHGFEGCGPDTRHRGGWEGAPAAAEVPPAERTVADEQAAKLDAMMELTLEHLKSRVTADTAAAAWSTLLAALERTLLPTQRSKFTQFLLFYLARQDPEKWCGELLRSLLERLAESTAAPLTRSAAAAYVGSFLARAAFVPESHLLEAMQGLALWCIRYCKAADARSAKSASTAAPPGFHRQSAVQATRASGIGGDALIVHQVFYSAFQALLYVMCYRLEELMASQQRQAVCPPETAFGPKPANISIPTASETVIDLFQSVMPQLVSHRLDPLSACNHTVVAEFSRLTSRLKLLPRGALRPSLLPADATAAPRRPLQMFFPFDPYLLHHSARFLDLQESYVLWKRGYAGTEAVEACPGASDGGGASVYGDHDDDDDDDDSADGGGSDSSSSSSSTTDDDEPRSLPASERLTAVHRSYSSAAFQPITSLIAGRRAVSAGNYRSVFQQPWSSAGLPPDRSTQNSLNAQDGPSPSQGMQTPWHREGSGSHTTGSVSTQGGNDMRGASPWGRQSYGASPGGGMAMSWAPEIQLSGFQGPISK